MAAETEKDNEKEEGMWRPAARETDENAMCYRMCYISYYTMWYKTKPFTGTIKDNDTKKSPDTRKLSQAE